MEMPAIDANENGVGAIAPTPFIAPIATPLAAIAQVAAVQRGACIEESRVDDSRFELRDAAFIAAAQRAMDLRHATAARCHASRVRYAERMVPSLVTVALVRLGRRLGARIECE
jgi:hypothetical protein